MCVGAFFFVVLLLFVVVLLILCCFVGVYVFVIFCFVCFVFLRKIISTLFMSTGLDYCRQAYETCKQYLCIQYNCDGNIDLVTYHLHSAYYTKVTYINLVLQFYI